MSKKRGKHKNQIDAIQQMNTKLNSIFVPGTKKSDAERYQIRSYQSLKNYKNIGTRFIKWCEETYNTKDFNKMRDFIGNYLSQLKNEKSNATLKTYSSGLSKIFDISNDEIVLQAKEIDPTYDTTLRREDFKRSSNYYKTRVNENINNNCSIKKFACDCGLRRRELEKLTPSNVKYDENGTVILNLTANKKDANAEETAVVSCKGGKSRVVHTFIKQNTESFKILHNWLENCSESHKPILEQNNIIISKNLDIHNFRKVFANKCYEHYARPISEIDENERIPAQRKNKSSDGLVSPVIKLKQDLEDTKLDREACRIVAKELGHNREEVFQTSYFRKDMIGDLTKIS